MTDTTTQRSPSADSNLSTEVAAEVDEAAERPTHHTRVADVADLTPNLRAITLRGGLDQFESHDGDQWLALLVPDPDTDQLPDDLTIQQWQAMDPDRRPSAATYTVRRFDARRHELELWVVLHDHDRGVAAWARDARVGDHVAVTASHRSLHWPDELDHVLLAGDETALTAIAALLDELVEMPDVTVDVVVETFDTGHALDLPGPHETTVHWVFRGDDPPGTGSYLLDAVADLDLQADTFVFGATDTTRTRTQGPVARPWPRPEPRGRHRLLATRTLTAAPGGCPTRQHDQPAGDGGSGAGSAASEESRL